MGRALVIDDDEDVRLAVGLLLRRHGWDVDMHNAGRGVELCRTDPPDVLIVDYKMPDMSGIEVVERVRVDGYDGPIVLFSAYLTPEIEADASRLGVLSVSKVDFAGLVESIRPFASPGR